jgi:hypothetical protein
VDVGHGWLISALPPAGAAVQPSDESGTHEVYFMCDGLKPEMATLAKKNVECLWFRKRDGVPFIRTVGGSLRLNLIPSRLLYSQG